jgi:hypothetical protein
MSGNPPLLDEEGQQLFNEDDDDGVGFVAERTIDDERYVGTDTYVADDEVHVHVPIHDDTINKMSMIELKNELKLRQQSVYGAKFQLKKRLIEALDKKLPKYTAESLAKKKATATEAKKKNTTQGLSSSSRNAFWKELKPNQAVVQEPTNPSFKIQRVYVPTVPQEDVAHVPVNSSPAIMSLAALYFGVLFWGAYLPQKSDSHDTSSFKSTCHLIRLKVLPDGLYGAHLHCDGAIIKNRKRTV